MSRLKTEYQSSPAQSTLDASSHDSAPEWFRWESQGHSDFVAIQINMLMRLAKRRQLHIDNQID